MASGPSLSFSFTAVVASLVKPLAPLVTLAIVSSMTAPVSAAVVTASAASG